MKTKETTLMRNNDRFDFALEKRLAKTDPVLHKKFTESVFGLQHILSNYKLLFPKYTDHSELHSMSVINFCNWLIAEQIEKMNADEIYVLLMSCYLHDTGMGITMKDYEQFSEMIDFGDYFETHSREDTVRIIRDFHHEFSGCFIRKYAPFFDIPSEEHLNAIINTSRGHRKTNLKDETVYPIEYKLSNGNTVCMPYLAALIRLADEIDVAAARNPVLLYDLESVMDDIVEYIENKKLLSVHNLFVDREEFTVIAEETEDMITESIHKMVNKMQMTLDQCRDAVNGRTPFVITQERVILKYITVGSETE